jgi:hypothetical protein
LSTVLLKHEEISGTCTKTPQTYYRYSCAHYVICFLIVISICRAVPLISYDYNLRQFTIDSLLAARQMFSSCPWVYYKSFPSASLLFLLKMKLKYSSMYILRNDVANAIHKEYIYKDFSPDWFCHIYSLKLHAFVKIHTLWTLSNWYRQLDW